MKSVTILGSTGSIGKSTLEVIEKNPSHFKVKALAAKSDIKTLLSQVYKFKPDYVSVFDEKENNEIKKLLPRGVKLLPPHLSGLSELIMLSRSDITVVSLTGAIGLLPIMTALKYSKRVCIANKEPVVIAGKIMVEIAKKEKKEIIPIDSEPSAIFQSLNGNDISKVKKIILTASGGPFYNYRGDFSKITPEMAIKHPRWNMGAKISVDSATLMNKGLEAIEISNLFGISIDKIEIVIHPQSVVHSAVEFIDGSIIAQLSNPDMRIPIQYSLTYPDRLKSCWKNLSLVEVSRLDFIPPDTKKFKSIKLCIEAGKKGGLYPAVLNAANEEAVKMFLLKREIKFNEVVEVVEFVMNKYDNVKSRTRIDSIAEIIRADDWARKKAKEYLNKRSKL